MKERNIMQKFLWNQSDYAAFLGTTPATICKTLKNNPERLAPPVPHPIGKSLLWNKEDVIRWYSAADSIQHNASDLRDPKKIFG